MAMRNDTTDISMPSVTAMYNGRLLFEMMELYDSFSSRLRLYELFPSSLWS